MIRFDSMIDSMIDSMRATMRGVTRARRPPPRARDSASRAPPHSTFARRRAFARAFRWRPTAYASVART
jgi:hypothetical protein